MTLKALLLSIVIFFGINTSVFCQNLLKYIPNDATFVVTFNPKALNAKIPFSKLKQYSFFKMSMEEMAKSMDSANKEEMLKLLDDPSNYGMDMMSSSYIFGKVTSEGNAFSYIFKLSDAAKFNQFLKSKIPADVEMVSMDGFNMVTPDHDMSFAWNNEIVLITGVEVHRQYDDYDYGYDYEENPYNEEGEIYYEEQEIMEEQDTMVETPIEEMEIVEEAPYEEVEEIEEVIVEDLKDVEAPEQEMEIVEEENIYQDAPVEELEDAEIMEYPEVEQPYFPYDDSAEVEHAQKEKDFALNWVKMIMGSDGSISIMKHPKFITANAKKTDANLWLDYASFYKLYMEEMGSYGSSEAAMFAEMLGSFYNDTYLSMGVNFDAGAVNFNIDTYANSQMMKFYRESTDAKFNKKFHKYIPAENLMGYWNFNINFENTVEGYKDLLMPMLKSIPMYGGMADDMVDILDIFIDEEAIYDLWDGDIFVGVTGMREFERTITTYEFDADFNRIETQQTVTQKLPEFLMMASFDNEENVRKFLKLGENTPYLQNKGSYYLAKFPDEDMDFYIALHKGIFFFTNNSDLIQNRLNSGYPKKERMSKADCKRIKDNSMVFYWDIPQTLNAASAFGVPLAGPQGELLNVSKDSFQSIVWTTPKGGEQSINQSLSLNFVNKEMNSMEQMFNYINEVVVMMMGDTSM